jgi:hypothetical protein
MTSCAPHILLKEGLLTRITGCTCGWSMPKGVTDSDDAYATHVAITNISNVKERRMSKNAFNGVKVFSATMLAQRQELGETVTAWIEKARATKSGFQIVDMQMTQSSDEAFHCLACWLFYKEDLKR